MQPFGDRSKVVIEPMLTDQWFVDAKTMAEPAIASVREGRTNFVPKNWENTYFNWMENIEPWCISRQLWWGHQIPVWYGPKIENGVVLANEFEMFCAKDEASAISKARIFYGDQCVVLDDIANQEKVGSLSQYLGKLSGEAVERSVFEFALYRDPDVLDTWFSSALWPFSTLGWPDQTKELQKYYQTDVLVTGFDIIFFWVARMMMFGLHFMKDASGTPVEPFHTVYMHALVRDEDGHKMSKSVGNVIDPLDLIQGIDTDGLVEKRTYGLARPQDAPKIEKATRKRYPDGFEAFGADALRFTLAIMAAQGRDVKLSVDRVAGYRNFGTKLWNATRFAQMNGVKSNPDFDPNDTKLTISRWILTELSICIEEVTDNLERQRFNDAAGALYKFVWNTLCDWYLELLKPTFNGNDDKTKSEAQACAGYVFDQIYALLHPFMPFMTEHLWDVTGSHDVLLCHSEWPTSRFEDKDAAQEINWLIDLVSQIRSIRAEMNVKPSLMMRLSVTDAIEQTRARIASHESAIETLARIESIDFSSHLPKNAAQIILGEATYCMPLEGLIDLSEERARLEKELKKLAEEIKRLEGKLGNEKFIANAPEMIVAEEREKLADYLNQREKIGTALERVKL